MFFITTVSHSVLNFVRSSVWMRVYLELTFHPLSLLNGTAKGALDVWGRGRGPWGSLRP